MARIEVDVGPFPDAVRSAVIDYARAGSPSFLRLGETQDRVSTWAVPWDRTITVRARFRSARGKIGEGTETRYFTGAELTNRPHPDDLDIPAAVGAQDGPAVVVEQAVPVGVDPAEFDVEAVQGTTAMDTAAEVKDGLHLGHVAAGEPILASAWQGGQSIATRLVRKEDGARSAWAFVEVASAAPAMDPTLAHSTGFAGGTIGKFGGAANPASMEVTGGDLLHKAIYAGDVAGFAGSLTDIYAGEMRLRWPGIYTTPNIALPANESIQLQWQPVLTSIARPVRYAGDWTDYAGGPPRFDPAGQARDPRAHLHNLTAGGGDDVPMEIEASVATSATDSPSFAAADFEPWDPRMVWHDVNTYAMKFRVESSYGKVVTLDAIRVWHWIWCRSRPWHTHSDAYELLYDFTAGANLPSLTANVALAGWDDVRIEVQWKNADASPSQLFLRLNNDSGANYHKDGAAGATSMLVGPGTIGATWWERAVIRLVNPAAGAERACRVESTARWNGTTSEAPGDEATVMWDNTADAISSIVFDGTIGATPLATGSRVRIFGKRHHEE